MSDVAQNVTEQSFTFFSKPKTKDEMEKTKLGTPRYLIWLLYALVLLAAHTYIVVQFYKTAFEISLGPYNQKTNIEQNGLANTQQKFLHNMS